MDFDEQGRLGIAEHGVSLPEDWDLSLHQSRLEELYTSQRPFLSSYFRRNAHPQDVSDLVQECFRKLMSAKGSFAANLDKPGAYLARTAQNILKNRYRSSIRQEHSAHHSFDDQEIAGPDPHMALEARDTIRRAEQAIARLGITTQEVFLMHRFENLSYEDIARIKGMSTKRVEKHIAKALAAVRKARDS